MDEDEDGELYGHEAEYSSSIQHSYLQERLDIHSLLQHTIKWIIDLEIIWMLFFYPPGKTLAQPSPSPPRRTRIRGSSSMSKPPRAWIWVRVRTSSTLVGRFFSLWALHGGCMHLLFKDTKSTISLLMSGGCCSKPHAGCHLCKLAWHTDFVTCCSLIAKFLIWQFHDILAIQLQKWACLLLSLRTCMHPCNMTVNDISLLFQMSLSSVLFSKLALMQAVGVCVKRDDETKEMETFSTAQQRMLHVAQKTDFMCCMSTYSTWLPLCNALIICLHLRRLFFSCSYIHLQHSPLCRLSELPILQWAEIVSVP